MTMREQIVTASAPGKVLVTGGYLVLDPTYSGFVLATDARFYATVRRRQCSDTRHLTVHVESPQFTLSAREYLIDIDQWTISQVDSLTSNKYIELALLYTSMSCSTSIELAGLCMDITIQGDNDFYSQSHILESRGLDRSLASLSQLQKFQPLGIPIEQVHKTGLGSSAALVVSLVAALLTFLTKDSEGHKRILIHNLAQTVHCAAQGKIGSGFDVSSAVYGSHVYKRFSPKCVSEFLSDNISPETQSKCVNSSEWNASVQQCRLPKGFRLVLADVSAGSSTPSMVRKVLEWKAANPELSNEIWDKINKSNSMIVSLIEQLIAQENISEFENARNQLAAQSLSDLKVEDDTGILSLVQKLSLESLRLRSMLRNLSDLSGVPIEPLEQTRLLDACLKCPGVVMAGVPGAGGSDAIFCIVLDGACIDKLDMLFQSWSETRVCPLLATESSQGAGLQIQRN